MQTATRIRSHPSPQTGGNALTFSVQHYRVDRRQIGFLKFILEACDGIATMSTVDAGLGLVSLRIPPGCEEEVAGILQGLEEDIFMEKR